MKSQEEMGMGMAFHWGSSEFQFLYQVKLEDSETDFS